jgi:hypothetical protein
MARLDACGEAGLLNGERGWQARGARLLPSASVERSIDRW